MNTRISRQIGRYLVPFAITAIFVGLSFATGCTSNAPKTAATQGAVTVAAAAGSMVGTGETLSIVATAGSGGVTWSLTGTNCSGSACGTLTGVTPTSVSYVAPATLSGSSLTVTLTATSVSVTSSNASITLTVLPLSVTITPFATSVLSSGATVTLRATVNNDSTGDGVTWSLSGTGCSGAACGTLTDATTTFVTYTAPITFTALTVSITGTSVAVPGESASQSLSVSASAPISVTIVPPASTTLGSGTSLALTAAITNDVNSAGVAWSLSGAHCSGTACGALTNATPTTVTYTAPTLTTGNLAVTITATSVADPAASAALALTAISSSLTFSPTSLPPAIDGQAYSATIQISGGVPPYTITETNLPSWATATPGTDSVTIAGTPNGTMTTTGTITYGTPALLDTGTYNVQYNVTDSAIPKPSTGGGQIPLTTYYSPNPANSMLTGSYAFYGTGYQDGATIGATALTPIGYIGSIITDGNGNITGGELDINDADGLSSYTGIAGTYNVQTNQTGVITLLPAPGVTPITLAVGLGGIDSGNVATTGQFIEYDDSTGIAAGSTGVRLSGEMTQQTSTALSTSTSPFTGSYAFGMAGYNPSASINATCQAASACGPLSSAGAITFTSGGAIAIGEEDIAQGSVSVTQVSLSGALANAGNTDASGRITGTLTAANSSLLNWPVDYVAYMVDPQTFYVMSADSFATTSLLSGKAEQQNLADIAAMPFSATESFVLFGNNVGGESVATPQDGSSLAEVGLLTPVPAGTTTGTVSGLVATGGNTTGTAAFTKTTLTNIGYTVEPVTGRVTFTSTSSPTGLPELYLVDTNQGFATQQPTAGTQPTGMLEFLPQTSESLNAGNYTFSLFKSTGPQGTMEAATIHLPSASTSGATTIDSGQMYANFANTSNDQSNKSGTLLYDELLTGSLTNTNGVLSSISVTAGAEVCGTGGTGYVISSTQFACLSGAKAVIQGFVFFQQ